MILSPVYESWRVFNAGYFDIISLPTSNAYVVHLCNGAICIANRKSDMLQWTTNKLCPNKKLYNKYRHRMKYRCSLYEWVLCLNKRSAWIFPLGCAIHILQVGWWWGGGGGVCVCVGGGWGYHFWPWTGCVCCLYEFERIDFKIHIVCMCVIDPKLFLCGPLCIFLNENVLISIKFS